MRTETKYWEALEFRTACALDGTPVQLSTYRRNGFTIPQIPPHLVDGEKEPVDEEEIQETQDIVCYGLNEIERRTWHKIMLGWRLHAIAKDEGVSHPAIYARIRGSKGNEGMVSKNRFVWYWWQVRRLGGEL